MLNASPGTGNTSLHGKQGKPPGFTVSVKIRDAAGGTILLRPAGDRLFCRAAVFIGKSNVLLPVVQGNIVLARADMVTNGASHRLMQGRHTI